jgi:hypothetical protein
MAILYVASTGSNTSPYDTWAKAATALLTATAAAAAGDTIYAHQESEALVADTTYTLAAGVSIICSNDTTNAPPQTLGTRTQDGSGTNGVDVSFSGGPFFARGLSVKAGQSSSAANVNLALADGTVARYEACSFEIGGSSGNSRITFGGASNALTTKVETFGCTFTFNGSSSGQSIDIRGPWFSEDDTFAFPATMPSVLFANFVTVSGYRLRMVGADLSGFTGTLVGAAGQGLFLAEFYACDLHASVVPLGATTSEAQSEVWLFDCHSGDVHYNFAHYDHVGSTTISSSIYLNNGATADGSTHYSWVVAGNANTTFVAPYRSPLIHAFNTDVSTSITPRFEILRDGSSTAFTDEQVWGEWLYKNASGSVLLGLTSDRRGLLASAANQANSSLTAADWTGDGSPSPWAGKLEPAAFTPAEAGYISGRVVVSGNITVYVNPEILGIA